MSNKTDKVSGQNPHINHEPSSLDGLNEAWEQGKLYTPSIEGNLVREKIDRTNDFKQAGEWYRLFEDWERDELISNLVNTLAPCHQVIQDKMIDLFTKCDKDYGRRVAEGLEMATDRQKQRGPIASIAPKEGVKKAQKESKKGDAY